MTEREEEAEGGQASQIPAPDSREAGVEARPEAELPEAAPGAPPAGDEAPVAPPVLPEAGEAAEAPAVLPEAGEAAEAPAVLAEAGEAGPPVPPRRRFRRLRKAAPVLAGMALFALVFFAGFATHMVVADDDLSGIEDRLESLDARTGGIEQTLAQITGQPTQPITAPRELTEEAKDDPTWGPADAKVVVQEFGDFQCPYCGRFARETMAQLKLVYQDRVRFIYRDFPITGHQFAQKAAEAAQCAHDQGRFWEYHDLLYENQGALAVPQLKEHATTAGLDGGEFNECLDSGKNANEVALDLQDGARSGVTGTPAFIINGMMMTGAQPLAQFQSVLDQTLAATD